MVYLGQEWVLAVGLAVAGFRGWYRVEGCEAIGGLPGGGRLPGMVLSSCTRLPPWGASPVAALSLSRFLLAYLLSLGEEEEGHLETEVDREFSLSFKFPSFSSSSSSVKTDC